MSGTAPRVSDTQTLPAGVQRTAQTRPAAGRRTLVVVLLTALLGALALATLGAGADRGQIAVFTGDSDRDFSVEPDVEPPAAPDEWAMPLEPPEPPEGDGGGSGLLIAVAVLVAVLVAVAIWVLLRMRELARPQLVSAGDAADEEELTTDQARAALDDARDRLSTVVDAHDAVIAAWLALERAIAASGVRRRPSQTTLEFVVAVLGSLDLDATALNRLAHLYRRALFDDQPLGEGDRDEALTHLGTLTDDLDARTAREAR